MTLISDATLMAYADRELGDARTKAVRRALANDPSLRARLEQIQTLDEQVRAAFAPDLDVPERFTDLLRAETPSKLVQLDGRRKTSNMRDWIPAGAAVAAGVAGLVAGGLLTSGATAWRQPVDGGIAIAGAMQEVIMNATSGKTVQADGLSVTPILSFLAADDSPCREIHIADREMAARIVACKDNGDAEWHIEAFARVPVTGPNSSYRTAGPHKDPVIEAAFARLKVKVVLDAGAERQAIATGWSEK